MFADVYIRQALAIRHFAVCPYPAAYLRVYRQSYLRKSLDPYE